MVSTIQELQNVLSAKHLKFKAKYAINGTLACAMQWGDIDTESVQKKVAKAFRPIKDAVDRIPGITRGSRYGPFRASFETIVTKIFPLLVSNHEALQYWIDQWDREHPADESTPVEIQPGSLTVSRPLSNAINNESAIVQHFSFVFDIKDRLKLKSDFVVT